MKIKLKKQKNGVFVYGLSKLPIDVTLEEAQKYALKYDVEILESKVNKPKKGKNVYFYQHYIYKIGGIETFLYHMATYYQDYNITVLYDIADTNQLFRLAPYVNLKKREEAIDCDILIINNYPLVRVLDDEEVNYKKAYLMIHADFRGHFSEVKTFIKHPKVTKYLAVSKSAQEGLKEVFGLDSVLMYNFIDQDYVGKDKSRKVLKLITLSRATREKGIDRVLKMAQELKEKQIPFFWLLCGTIAEQEVDQETLNGLRSIPEIIFVPPTLSNSDLIPLCDYVVQLSDVESYCYSVHEGFSYGVPAIVTDFPEALEIIKEGENGYLVNMDMTNLDVEKFYNKIPKKAVYIEKVDHKLWKKLFEKGVL